MLTRRRFLKVMGGVGALGVSTTAYGFGIEPERLKVTRYDLAPPQWPADFKLKIAVIADLHACDPWMSLKRIEGIVAHTNALRPDITLLLGDYVAGHRKVTRFIPRRNGLPCSPHSRHRSAFMPCLAITIGGKTRTFSGPGMGSPIAGRALESAGIPVYDNDAKRLSKDGRPFWLTGLGDQLAYMPARRFRPVRRIGVDDLGATLAKVTGERAGHPDGARARYRQARTLACRAAAVGAYPWRPGAPGRLVADRAFRP